MKTARVRRCRRREHDMQNGLQISESEYYPEAAHVLRDNTRAKYCSDRQPFGGQAPDET